MKTVFATIPLKYVNDLCCDWLTFVYWCSSRCCSSGKLKFLDTEYVNYINGRSYVNELSYDSYGGNFCLHTLFTYCSTSSFISKKHEKFCFSLNQPFEVVLLKQILGFEF